MMHQPHQSEPVKSIRSSFCLVFASSWAWAKFVSQPLLAEPEPFDVSWAVELFEHEMANSPATTSSVRRFITPEHSRTFIERASDRFRTELARRGPRRAKN